MLFRTIDVTGEGSQKYAHLNVYILDDSEEYKVRTRPMIVICPGGAYCFTSDREDELVAMQYLSFGYNAAVLRYSVAPSLYPAAILELGRSMKIIRENAKEWHIDPDKICVSGFSAGGHMAANYCEIWSQGFIAEKVSTTKDMLKPNGLILSYPVITSGEYAHSDSFKNLLGDNYEKMKDELSLENHVNEDVPKTFIWSTYNDNLVPIQNSLLFVEALVKMKISVEFHMFSNGIHGLSLAKDITADRNGYGVQEECESWIEMAHKWIEKL